MKRFGWYIAMGLSLVLASAVIYIVQIQLFHRNSDTWFYMMQDLAFIPIQVLLVTLIINALLKSRERDAMQLKMNMVIGSFFSEMGTDLLKTLSSFEAHTQELAKAVLVRADWSGKDFQAAQRYAQTHEYAMDCRRGDLGEVKTLLLDNRRFLLTLLENPNLLEHETFTDLLWAVSHLTEELWHRKDLSRLSEPDSEHLAGDMRRAYVLLIIEWLSYTRHLKDAYPYILSLIIRTNPFDPAAVVEIEA